MEVCYSGRKHSTVCHLAFSFTKIHHGKFSDITKDFLSLPITRQYIIFLETFWYGICHLKLVFSIAELICCHESTGYHDITEKARRRGPEQRRHVYYQKRNQCIKCKKVHSFCDDFCCKNVLFLAKCNYSMNIM